MVERERGFWKDGRPSVAAQAELCGCRVVGTLAPQADAALPLLIALLSWLGSRQQRCVCCPEQQPPVL